VLKKSKVDSNLKVQHLDLLSITLPMMNRMKVEAKSEQTIKSYVRAIDRLIRFHGLIHPKEFATKSKMSWTATQQ